MENFFYACASTLLFTFFNMFPSTSKEIAESIDFHYNLTPLQRLTKHYENTKTDPPSISDGQLHFALKEFPEFHNMLSQNTRGSKKLKRLVNNFQDSLTEVKAQRKKKPSPKKKKIIPEKRVPETHPEKKEFDGFDLLLIADRYIKQREAGGGIKTLLKTAEQIEKKPTRPRKKRKKKNKKRKLPKLKLKIKNLKRRRDDQETPDDPDFFPMKTKNDYNLRPRKKKRKRE